MSDTYSLGRQPDAPMATPPGEGERDDEIDLARLGGILAVGKWKIAAALAGALALALVYLYVAAPTYQVDALLHIQTQGSPALQGMMELERELGAGGSSPAKAQMEIITSRAVLGETVNELDLDRVVRPRFFPVFGQAIARRRELGDPLAAWMGLDSAGWFSRYAWSPVHADVTRLNVPPALHSRPLTLRALDGERYAVFGPQGRRLVEGRVGEAASGTTRAGEPVALFVAGLAVTTPPTDFTLLQRPWLAVVEGLQSRLQVAEQGQETGIVKITLEGEDPATLTDIVNSVADNYLRQNVEARSEEAEKSLAFLNEQLPALRAELRAAESALTEYREAQQATDLDAEAQALLDQVVELENKRSQLDLKLAELRQTYTGEHPALEAVRGQQASLRQEREQLQSRIGALPAAQKAMLRLRRDVEVNTKLYTALLNRAQELRVVKAGTTGNVRIIDRAVEPIRAVSPKSGLVLALALVLGGMAGGGYVLVEAAMRRGVIDPKEIERLGVSVYATVPYSPWLAQHTRGHRRRDGDAPLPVLARDKGEDMAVEALRSMRTNLHFAQTGAASDVVLVTGPTAGVGKSYVSINLAYLLAEVGKRVVIVDGDLRKGTLHEYSAYGRGPGLSEVLAGELDVQDALKALDGPRLQFLASGRLPPNPSELLMRETLAQAVGRLREMFDMVIVDAAPVLAVTDAAIISASIPEAITFLVARAGEHPIAELEESVHRLSHGGGRFAGVIFNGLRAEHVRYGGGYGAYYYRYAYKPQAT